MKIIKFSIFIIAFVYLKTSLASTSVNMKVDLWIKGNNILSSDFNMDLGKSKEFQNISFADGSKYHLKLKTKKEFPSPEDKTAYMVKLDLIIEKKLNGKTEKLSNSSIVTLPGEPAEIAQVEINGLEILKLRVLPTENL